jgi:hypothetical protein
MQNISLYGCLKWKSASNILENKFSVTSVHIKALIQFWLQLLFHVYLTLYQLYRSCGIEEDEAWMKIMN